MWGASRSRCGGEVKEAGEVFAVAFVADGHTSVAGEPGGWVGRAARCLMRQILFRAASRRTGLDGFPIIRLSGDYCVGGAARLPRSRRTLSTVSALCITHTSRSGRVHITWPPSPLWSAFPTSSAGRDSGDYYEASVAMGLAPGRRSRVRLCRT